jgi:hypothetical protein
MKEENIINYNKIGGYLYSFSPEKYENIIKRKNIFSVNLYKLFKIKEKW